MSSCNKNCLCSLCKPWGFPISKVFRGIDEYQVLQRTSSQSCCPKYFFNNGDNVGIPIPPKSSVEVINVSVTTDSHNERVKLDSMFFTAITMETDNLDYCFQIAYKLFRDNIQLTTVELSNVSLVKQHGNNALIADTTNIFWTDVPGSAGTYNYRITAERNTPDENIFNVSVLSRSINAIVFPSKNNS